MMHIGIEVRSQEGVGLLWKGQNLSQHWLSPLCALHSARFYGSQV